MNLWNSWNLLNLLNISSTMRRYHSYINTALQLIASYKGEIPFSIFIKKFFSQEKKFGSRDRKQIASVCYSYFRAGRLLNRKVNEENLLAAFFLSNTSSSELLSNLKPGWDEKIQLPVEEKIKLLNLQLQAVFPFEEELNNDIGRVSLYKSFLVQPDLFARIRPQHKAATLEKIKRSGVEYRLLNNDTCVQFASGTNIENFLLPDKEAVVQDYNSQQVLNYLPENNFTGDKKEISVWDCCAASGGKSILIYDLLNGKINLTVSDIRESIIANLQHRFKTAGIKNYRHFVADSSSNENPCSYRTPAEVYDIIICDAPCTGSGTWSRTPEQLYFFNPAAIEEYAARQKKITINILPHLKTGGLLFYITCSVFKKENEEVVEYICRQKNMELVEMKNLYGYNVKADSMFVAVLKKQAIA